MKKIFLCLLVIYSLSAEKNYYNEVKNFLEKKETTTDINNKPILEEMGISRKTIEKVISLINNTFICKEEEAPKIHKLVEAICKKTNTKKPTIHISSKNIYNAMAYIDQIVICLPLLNDLEDSEFEAIIAHEIGHIHHKHVLKRIAIIASCGTMLSTIYIISYMLKVDINFKKRVGLDLIFQLFPKLIEGKRFEREADLFAIKNGYAKPLAKSMFKFKKHKEVNDEMLKDNAFYKIMNNLQKTRLFPHPTFEERIETAEQYIAA